MPDQPTTGAHPLPDRARSARRPLFLKQKNMQRVLYALSPILLAGVYFFGWRVAVLVAVCSAAGAGTEFLTARRRGAPVSQACLVTCWLYALSLPPTMPFWQAVVGIVAAILFGKEVFGGFGRNFANPAIVGRTFVYVCFPNEMTSAFVPVFRGWPGGLAQWSFQRLRDLPAYLVGPGRAVTDAVSSATPMMARRSGHFVTPLGQLLTGDIGGTFQGPGGTQVLAAGSIGEVSALLILLAGAYLLVTRTANWRLTAGTLGGALLANALFAAFGGNVPSIPFTLLSGALLYAAVFMVTDPVSAPKRPPAMLAYGALIGVFIVLLRWKGTFVGAVGFAILLGNIVGPLLDLAAGAIRPRRARPETPAEAPAEGRA